MKRGNATHQATVHLLGEGRVFIVSAQSRLHVAHGDLTVKRRQGAYKGGGGITVDQHQIGLGCGQNALHPGQRLGGDGEQALAGLHNIQIVIRLQAKDVQHAVQHLPVLGGNGAEAFKRLLPGQLPHQGDHFDGLGPGAEHRKDPQFLHGSSSPSPTSSSSVSTSPSGSSR